MDSFRAEAHGFLAGTCLLHLLTHAHSDSITNSVHTDSASLLSRLTRATADYVPTGFWLKPGSDIIMQLVDEIKPFNKLQRQHVKGHQDVKKKRADLTLPELYNVEADAEATIMQFQMTGPASHVTPFSASMVNVCVNQQIISSKLDTLLHATHTNADCWTCLEKKFKWTPTTRKLIAWSLCHKLLNNQPNKQHQQLIKCSVEWLPTGYEVHRHNPLEDHRCPHCKTVPERNAHLLCCPHPARVAQREKFLSVTLNNFYHKSNTAQPIREFISQSLIQWFRNPAHPKRFPRTHPLHRASIQQQAIGWKHFLQGQIATSIIDYQEKHCRDRERPAKETGLAWAQNLIQQLWGHFYNVWKFRCDERHKLDKSKVSKQHTHRVHGRARACHTALPDLPIEIRSHHYFAKTIDKQIDQDTRKIEEWLAHAEPLVQQGIAKMAQTTSALPDIRDYFPAIPAAL
jgi:hypothetical protein